MIHKNKESINRNANIRHISENLYEISCIAIADDIFSIINVLAVDETISFGPVAEIKIGENNYILSVNFDAMVTEINQELIDFSHGKITTKNQTFAHTDWICRVKEIPSVSYFQLYKSQLNNKLNVYYTERHLEKNKYQFGLNFFNLPRNAYIRNIQIIAKDPTNIQENEAICSFEYCPKTLLFDYLSGDQKIENINKYADKQPNIIYACYQFENIAINPNLLLLSQNSPDNWIEINNRTTYIIDATRKINHYQDYCLWFKTQGEYIWVGMDVNGNDYLNGHGFFPEHSLKVGQIIKKDEHFLRLTVHGPMDYEVNAYFDMEIISLNPKYENLSYGNNEDIFLHSFSEIDMYKESWLFIVKATDTAQINAYWDACVKNSLFV